MTFAAPLFLIATLAAAIPVVLHMINRQKARQLPFSTLRFLRLSVQKTRRRKRVHDVLLMLLRAAVLLLLAVGLAKPTLTSLRALWSRADTAVAIVLDNSASMGTLDQGQIRFRTALGAAEQILDQLQQGDEVALLVSNGPSQPEEGKLDPTHDKVRQMLRQWIGAPSVTSGLSYERADLATQVQEAQALLATSDAANKQIYVLTDLQTLSWETEAKEPDSPLSLWERAGVRAIQPRGQPPDTQPNSPSDTEETETDDVPIIFVDCNRAPKPNVAVLDVSLAAAVPVAGLPLSVTARLLNTSSVAQQRHLELHVDGTRQDSSPVLELAPGEPLGHEFTFTPTRSGLHRGQLRLAGEDGSELDDRRFFTLDVDQAIPVAVVKRRRHEIPYLEDTFYVEQALAPGASGAWAIRPASLVADDLLAEQLADYKVIFCVNLAAPARETAQRLAAYVAAGGNLVWICGDQVDPAAYNQMNQQAGGELLPAPLAEVRTAADQPGRDSWQIGFLDQNHPALGPLSEPAALYQSVLIYKHVRIESQDPSGASVLARLDDGEPLLLERNVQQGEVLLLGTSAHVGWSNLPLRPIFLPLLVRLTYDLAGVQHTRRDLLAGSPLLLPLPSTGRPTGIDVLPPSGETIRRQTEDDQGRPLATFRYDDTHQVGVYELHLFEPGGQRQIGFAVNLDPDEADPAKIDREDLQQRFGRTPLVFAEDPDDLSGTFAWLREGTSLWPWFLTAVLIALVFETLLANRLSPKPEEATADSPTSQKPTPLHEKAQALPTE